ncbi:MAG: HlyD family efflux transporter periplasmic adaptor subunit [Anaerolineae bacterium]|nr:HlyD family efflux transporter periplasmic adaptor subunit [Anaerolineae bacterium]
MRSCRLLWVVIVLVVLVTAGCSTPEPVELVPTQERPVPIQVGIAGSVVMGTGQVVLSQPADLSFPIAGQVIEISVKEGDRVQAGQVLARLDPTILDAALAQAEAQLEVYQADLAKVQAGASEQEIREAESLVESAKHNTALQELRRAAELSAAQARLDYLRSLPLPEDLELAQAQVREAETVVAKAQAERDLSTLVAPIAGEVTMVLVETYEYVNPGKVIIQLGDTSNLSVEILDMSEYDATRIAVGNKATVLFESLSKIEVPGVVLSIVQSDGTLGTFTVTITIEDPPAGIRPGMTAYVDIDISE